MVPGELFSGESKLVRGALLGGRFLTLVGHTRVEDPGSEIVKFTARRLGAVVVRVRNFCH